MISVDTKKKELVGDFRDAGRELPPQGQPEPVRVHDFKILELGKLAPYGVYDIPSGLVRAAKAHIGCKVISVWGMTEVSAVTTVRPDDNDEKAFETDGVAMPHCEVRIVDEIGTVMPNGGMGRLLTRDASQFAATSSVPSYMP